jgi:hypothetical protein
MFIPEIDADTICHFLESGKIEILEFFFIRNNIKVAVADTFLCRRGYGSIG